MSTKKVGVVGLGLMGWALAARLAAQGQKVGGWTRSGVDATRAQADGFEPHAALADLVAESDILILSLFDEVAVRDVLGQLGAMDLNQKLIVETSTVTPQVVRDLVNEIEAAGGRLIDAPISGGPEMVAEGTIGLFIGGAEEDAARFQPLVEQLSNRSAYVGPLGAGAAMKIVNNVALAGAFQAASDALQLGQNMGLELGPMLSVLDKSPGTTPMFKARVAKISGEDQEVGFALIGVVKDAKVFLTAGETYGVELPWLTVLSDNASSAIEAGLGDLDAAAVIRHRLNLE